MTKLSSIFLLCFFLQTGFSWGQSPAQLDVYWYLGSWGNNDSLDNLSYKLLQAISQDKIQTYDDSGKLTTKKQVEKAITPNLIKPMLTKEEISIMLSCGDYSFMEELETEYTAEELVRIMKEGKSIEKLIKYKKKKPFESSKLDIEIYERIYLDTNLRKQKGIFEYIRLMIPGDYTPSKKNELLCQLKYEDFKKLNLPEQKILDERRLVFVINDSDIRIVDEKKNQTVFSDMIFPGGKELDRHKVDSSIFKYFTESIKVFDTRGRLWNY